MPKSKRDELLKAARNYAINMLKVCETAEENNLSVEELETRLSKQGMTGKTINNPNGVSIK
jgi:hypothetical protein